MKKIIIITGHSPYQTYFINTLKEFVKNSQTLCLEGVFLSGRQPYRSKLKKQLLQKKSVSGAAGILWGSIRSRVVKRLTYPKQPGSKHKVYDKIFGDQWHRIRTNKVFYDKKRRISDWYSEIQQINPDIIVVHGGGIVPNQIIKQANAHTFNLHWGISPLYRGSFCTPFCILNNEIHNIGVTIHELSSDIDGGKIYASARPDIEAKDSIFSIEMKLTRLGAGMITELLKMIDTDMTPVCQPQTLSEGKLYRVKDYTIRKAVKVRKRITQGIIDAYYQKNTRKH